MEEENRYVTRYIDSDDQPGEAIAWKVWTEKFVAIIREFPQASFGWRSYPSCERDADFDTVKVQYKVRGRLIIDREGEPVPLPSRIYDDSSMFSGFGLAQVK